MWMAPGIPNLPMISSTTTLAIISALGSVLAKSSVHLVKWFSFTTINLCHLIVSGKGPMTSMKNPSMGSPTTYTPRGATFCLRDGFVCWHITLCVSIVPLIPLVLGSSRETFLIFSMFSWLFTFQRSEFKLKLANLFGKHLFASLIQFRQLVVFDIG